MSVIFLKSNGGVLKREYPDDGNVEFVIPPNAKKIRLCTAITKENNQYLEPVENEDESIPLDDEYSSRSNERCLSYIKDANFKLINNNKILKCVKDCISFDFTSTLREKITEYESRLDISKLKTAHKRICYFSCMRKLKNSNFEATDDKNYKNEIIYECKKCKSYKLWHNFKFDDNLHLKNCEYNI